MTGDGMTDGGYALALADDAHVLASGYSHSQRGHGMEPYGVATDSRRKIFREWIRLVGLVAVAVVVPAVLLVLLLPIFTAKVVIPAMEWEVTHFSRPVLALVLIFSMGTLPLVFVPTVPCMWLSGMVFSYGLGFLIIMVGTLMGLSIAFFLGRWIFQARIQAWIQKWPKWAALIRLADQGDWFQQYKVLLILRLSPIPYPLYNYALGTTNVKYGPYFCSSCTIVIPEAFLTIYSGRLLKSLADIKSPSHHVNRLEIISNVLGLCIMVCVTIVASIYGKKALKQLEMKEQAEDCEKAELKRHEPSSELCDNEGGKFGL